MSARPRRSGITRRRGTSRVTERNGDTAGPLTPIAMSALPPITDIPGGDQHVCFVPIADIRKRTFAIKKDRLAAVSEIHSGVLIANTAIRSGIEPGNLVTGGNAALRRQLVNKTWQNIRQLRSHVLFGHTRLFGQGLDK